jgi:hypothetical protein
MRHKRRDPLERRHDTVTATVIEVAIIYKRIFSRAACKDYLALCGVPAEIAVRILNNQHRHDPIGR